MARTALLALLLVAAAGCCGRCAAEVGADQIGAWARWLADAAASSPPAGGANGGALLPVLAAHKYATPLPAVQASQAYTGANARLRRVVADLLAGRPVKVVAVGGAATNGSAASVPGQTDYFSRYAAFLTRAFPSASVQAVRAPAGLAPSAVVAACLNAYVPSDADLVLLEMTANDGAAMDASIVAASQPRGFEALVRGVLSGAKRPAAVVVNTMPPGMGNGTRPFYLTPEAPQYAAVAGFYDIPTVSMRNALWPAGAAGADGTLNSKAVLASDGSTPTDAGHAAIADALVFLTQRTAQDLQVLPFGEWDARSIDAQPPRQGMYGGVADNTAWALRNATCGWVRNMSVSATGGCPGDVGQMCALDYSSWQSVREGYAARVAEVFGDGGERGNAALIGGVVGGVVAALALVGGAVAYAVVRQKRRAAAEEAAYNAKFGGGGNVFAAAPPGIATV